MGRCLPCRRGWGCSLLAAMAALASQSCQRRPLVDGLPPTSGCSSCHGSESNPAPPYALDGATSTTETSVGAHQAHVTAGSIGGSYGCNECHPVVTEMDGDSHPDPLSRGTQVIFGPTARSNGATPAWDRRSRTCRNTYCHGATLAGAKTSLIPDWTRVDGSQIECNSCHADDPTGLGDKHPAHKKYTCDACHAEVASGSLSIRNPSLHVDGLVEVKMAAGTWGGTARSCADTSDACHGNGSVPW